MIFDATSLPLPLELDVDLCVVGAGAGGSAAATLAAESGLSVLVLEAGDFIRPAEMTQREEQMLPRLLWAGGGRTTADRAVRIHQGRGVGGSTLHNLNLCGRIPSPILREWARTRGMRHLPEERWHSLYDEVETTLAVSAVARHRWNTHNQLLAKGSRALGWRWGGMRHNRSGCVGSGYCLLGCAYNAKNNAAKVFIPRLIAAGGQVITRCAAVVVTHNGGEVTGVEAVAVGRKGSEVLGRVRVHARRVCVSASATTTPAILMRSDVPDPSATTGRTLRVHPAVVAAGELDSPVYAWRGIPQTVECTQLLDFDAAHPIHGPVPDRAGLRTWIVPAFAHPIGTATMMPGVGSNHRKMMSSYAHMAVFTAMVHDVTCGRVSPRGDLGLTIEYWPNAADRRELVTGLTACARLLQAAGARRVFVPTDPVRELGPTEDLTPLSTLELEPGMIDITAVHPMSSVPMGDDPTQAAVGSDGAHHHLQGLWVADGSLFPTSIGVPPQLSIYAMGLHVGRAIAAADLSGT